MGLKKKKIPPIQMTIWPLVIKVAYGGHNGNGGILGEEWKSPLDNLQPLAHFSSRFGV